VFDGENTFEVAAPQIKAIDSVGAGDAYAGAFLYGITHGLGFKRAAELASQSGSAIVAQYGPRLSQDQVDKIKAS
jgi:sugar/nucleoside kinase (ribokinase family)